MRFSHKLRLIVATVLIGMASWSCSSGGGDEEFQEEIQEQEFDNQEAAEDQGFDQQQEFADDFSEGNSQQFANQQAENFTQEQLANLSEEELAELEAEVQSLQNLASNDAGQDDLQAILNDVNQEGNEFAQQNQDNLFANQNQDFGLDDANDVAANSFGDDTSFASDDAAGDDGYVDLGSDSSKEFVDLSGGDENVVESVSGAGDDNDYVSLEDDSNNYVDLAPKKSKRKKRTYRPSWRYAYETAPSVSVALPEMGTKMPYIIERGDTLSVVAKRIYGDMNRWQELANSNGISDVNRIFPGDLVYYTLDSSSQSFAQAYEGRGKSVYTAQAGETLRTIASKIYGTAQAWKILWRYNDSLDNPDTLQPGQSIYYAAPQRMSASVMGVKAKEEVVYNLSSQEELTAMQRIVGFFTQG